MLVHSYPFMQVDDEFWGWLDGSSTMPYASKVAAKLKTARAQRRI